MCYNQNMTVSPRIVFMGSPEFAVPSLKVLCMKYTIVGVVSQPDRPAGRGRKIASPPVKSTALELSIPVIQPERLYIPEAMSQLSAWKPNLIVVAAFGQILRPNILDLPSYGCINVHASLLPRWRGAAPVPAAILHGDTETGVTIMKMDPGVDTGPILSQHEIHIMPDDTAGTLSEKLTNLGATLLIETLPDYLSGKLQPQPQAGDLATYAPMLKKENGLLDFSQPADDLVRRIRAFNPWPGTYMIWQNMHLKVHRGHSIPSHFEPGHHLVHQGLPAVGTLKGILVLDEVQPPGRKSMPGKAFLTGARQWPYR
jgi:methionyl-tRNA formyltransferase